MTKFYTYLGFAIGVFFFLLALDASGQDRPVARLTPALTLARIAVSEAGWDETDDMPAIHHVLLRGAERMGGGRRGYVAFASAYAHRLIGEDGTIQRPWLRGLVPPDRRGRSPEPGMWGFRRQRDGSLSRVGGPPWRAYQARWATVYERAQRMVEEATLNDWDEWSPCEEQPDHWGGAMDRHRAERAGWRELDCGDTRNEFWTTENVEVD